MSVFSVAVPEDLVCIVLHVYFNESIHTSALFLQEPEMDSNKQADSPSEEEPSTPRVLSVRQNPKYQLFLSNDVKTNGESGRDTDGPGGDRSLGENDTKLSSWETTQVVANHHRGSMDSLVSQDLEVISDRVGEDDCGGYMMWLSNNNMYHLSNSAISWTEHSLNAFFDDGTLSNSVTPKQILFQHWCLFTVCEDFLTWFLYSITVHNILSVHYCNKNLLQQQAVFLSFTIFLYR